MPAPIPAPPDIDPCRCPLCGEPNGCALTSCGPGTDCDSTQACWCTRASFPASLLALVPPQAQRKACICARCVAAHAALAAPSP